MKLYNSLSRSVEELEFDQDVVGVYTCGPTVYSYVSIGNWRTYFLGDMLVRCLRHMDYQVRYVMNITDVGHLTGDNQGDANQGEDRLEKAATKEGKSAWEIAEYYAQDFLDGYRAMELSEPEIFCRATEHIDEQIQMIQKIEEAGLVYRIADGLYFDVGGYEKLGNEYGKLSTIDQVMEGARVEPNPDKRDPRDFALWKFSRIGEKRHMEWDSPWGVGFPGWHIECSAMSIKYLGDQFAIHIGGEDLRSTHHPNEIVQAEVATGRQPFVKYWVHGAFLTVDGGRMGKSIGNAYTLQDIVERGYEPQDLRYFYLGGHYRKPLNFTWEALTAARDARLRLGRLVADFGPSDASIDVGHAYIAAFDQALADDLNMPQALAVAWKMVRDGSLSETARGKLFGYMNTVLGIGWSAAGQIPEDVQKLVREREQLRSKGDFAQSDVLRDRIRRLGYEIEDTPLGTRVHKR